MDPEMASSLAEEMRVSEDLALMAVQEAEGELEKARDILNDLLPKYLAIKAKFMSSRSRGICGLVFIVIKKQAGNFLIFRTLSDGNRDWVSTVRVHRGPEMFFRTIKDYFDARSTSLLLFDAQKLKDGIQSRLSSASLQYIFELWDEPKTEIVPDSAPTEAFKKPGEILMASRKTDHLVYRY